MRGQASDVFDSASALNDPTIPRDHDHQLYRALFEAAGDAVVVCSEQGYAIECNQAALDLFACTREQLIGSSPADWSPEFQPNGRRSDEMAGEIIGRAHAGEVPRFEWENRRADGMKLPVEVTIRVARIGDRKLLVIISREITARKLSEGLLRQQMQFSADVINSLPGIFYMVTVHGQFLRVNHNFMEVTGYSREELDNLTAMDFFEGADKNLIAQKMGEVFEMGDASVEAYFKIKSGRMIPYYFTGRRTCIEDQHYLIGLGIDITERRALEQEMSRQARTDSLTGLSNRRHFIELAELELARARRFGKPLSVMMLDLDDFKRVNDLHGHQAGDDLLRAIAATCRKTLREIDIIGRLGGEEFAVLLTESDTIQTMEVAERLRRDIADAEVAQEHGDPLRITVSIGIAILTEETATVDKLLNLADKALYEAKRSGRNRVCVVGDQLGGAGS